MTCDEACYPAWLSGWIRLPSCAGCVVITYKYVRDCRSSGGDFAWEEDIANRMVELSAAPDSAWIFEDGVFAQAGAPVVVPFERPKPSECESDSVSTCADDESSCCSLDVTAPEQTLLFLDFDDTLFPTTHLSQSWGSIRLSTARRHALWRWSSALALYMRGAC